MNSNVQFSRSMLAAMALCGALAAAPQAPWLTTERASVSSAGVEANGVCITNSNTRLAVSGDGRCIAFNSAATNLVTGDTNAAPDLFLRDVLAGTTERMSVSSSGQQGNADNYGRGSYGAALGADGRFVAFYSYSSNLVAGDNGGKADVFVRDRVAGTTQRVSVSTSGGSPNSSSQSPSISDDGRYVLFDSYATNLVPSDRNKTLDVFVRDRVAMTTQRVSVGNGGVEANGSCNVHFCGNALSADGRYAVFLSLATNLVAGDTNGLLDAFVRDRLAGSTIRVSVGSDGVQADGAAEMACISGDGRFVAFVSAAANLAPPGAPAGKRQIYVYDRVAQVTTCASMSSTGQPGDNSTNDHAVLSADGRYIAFQSAASNLVVGDTNGLFDAFVRDLVLGTTTRLSASGTAWDGSGLGMAMDASGFTIAFASLATNLVPADTNGVKDVFVIR